MTEKLKKVRPSDLPTKRVKSPDGQWVTIKVVKSNSDNLEADFLAAFQSNVRRVRDERRERAADAAIAPKR